MRAVVVGAGAWGLPAAAELARRAHDVTLVDAVGPANPLGSSSGATRLWRLAHPDALRVRLGRRAVDAWRRLEGRSGQRLLLQRGLLWRDPLTTSDVLSALGAEDVEHVAVAADDVGRFFPGLRPTGVDAVWQPEAGPVLAAEALAACLALFESGGGRVRAGTTVREVAEGPAGVRLTLTGHGAGTEQLDADVVVLAPGPWAARLLTALGVDLPLYPQLEQVTYLAGGEGYEALPCWYEGETEGGESLYAMPTPGIGYKVGLDRPLRPFVDGDIDRGPDLLVAQAISDRARHDVEGLDPRVVSSQVCTWTMSPDGRFVVDRLLGGRVVLACGDSGEGFKFSALMGELLADLAEGGSPDADVATFGLARFDGLDPDGLHAGPPVLGR